MRNIVILNSLHFSYPLPILMRVSYNTLIVKQNTSDYYKYSDFRGKTADRSLSCDPLFRIGTIRCQGKSISRNRIRLDRRGRAAIASPGAGNRRNPFGRTPMRFRLSPPSSEGSFAAHARNPRCTRSIGFPECRECSCTGPV